MNDFNIDENAINKLKNMLNNGDLSNIVSQIPPEMMETVSNTMKNNTNSNKSQFDPSKLDAKTILKIQNIMSKLNNTNDPRTNLLYSLKPYLRNERKDKLDQYANLLNMAQIANLLKDTNTKENTNES